MGRASAPVVACAADAAYALPLAVMLRSAVASLAPGVGLTVHLVDGGLAAEDLERIRELLAEPTATLHVHELEGPDLSRLPTWGRMHVATYARLLLPDLLPPQTTKVLWLDCDLLVQADLALLWEAELGGQHVLAIRDPLVPCVSSRYGIRRWRELGLPAEAGYFNAGVMLIDLERWREDAIGDRAATYLSEHRDHALFWDQEGLNAVLSGRWGELDPRWNQPPSSFRRHPSSATPAERWIVHFSGNVKPWRLPKPPCGERARFYDVLDETPWAGWRPRHGVASAVLGWYEASRLRMLVHPLEPWVMLSLRRRFLTPAQS